MKHLSESRRAYAKRIHDDSHYCLALNEGCGSTFVRPGQRMTASCHFNAASCPCLPRTTETSTASSLATHSRHALSDLCVDGKELCRTPIDAYRFTLGKVRFSVACGLWVRSDTLCVARCHETVTLYR